MIETPDRGRYVTVLHVALGSEPGAWEVADGGVWQGLANARALWKQQVEPAAVEAQAKEVASLRRDVERATAGHDVVWVEDRPLGSDLDGPSPVDPLMAGFKHTVENAAAARVKQPPETGYQTAAGCVHCHSAYFAAWSFTPHAKAEEALIDRGKGLDPECVGCHTTAWGKPGGFSSADADSLSTWKAVQCEACHGPLRGHPEDDRVKPQPVTEATCRTCHDPANSPQFDFETYRKRISCLNVGK